MQAFLSALLMQAGYNTALVTLGAALLGAAGGAVGAFVLLRRRSLVSDAMGHATLPGLALAFIVMAVWTGNGRWMPGLMLGAAISATLGMLAVGAIVGRTRLREDAAIGAVLSVFFGAGVVLLTVIQVMRTGSQAGLGSYLLGSAAGMLRSEAVLIAVMAAVTALAIFLLRRRFALVAFDADYAEVSGVNVRRADLALSLVLLAVVVTGLKVVGLVLSVALTIIPAVAARFWTERVHRMVPIAAGLGAVGGYVGAALSSTARGLPTGSLIVLTLFSIFAVSMLLAPSRGLLAVAVRYYAFRLRVHRRQGLLAIGRGEPIYDGLTLRVLRRAGHIRRDGVATEAGAIAAAQAAHDEALWMQYRRDSPGSVSAGLYQRVLPIREVLPPDTLADLERKLEAAR
ncbi:Manganese ABC transporter, inner membrane permease protein SitC [plant metagenome]|uniref:Manganese ABC transporter, inner membrane permease protein SitC n=1 Tax=plant metagenome TaxID=1297885 RepID=A0A484PE62_9ZZZZ